MAARKLGWIPDPPKKPGEKPDWDFAKLRRPSGVAESMAIAEAMTRERILSILSQKGSDCVANAVMQAIRAKTGEELGARMWGYYLARGYHGMQQWDTGTHIRSCFRGVRNHGFLPESDYSYLYDFDDHFASKPTPRDVHRAADQRSPTDYYRIYATDDQREQDIDHALAIGDPVVWGMDVTKAFTKNNGYDWDKPVLAPQPGETIAGGHAMMLCEDAGDFYWGANSWGDDWGLAGLFKVSKALMRHGGTRDIWAIHVAPTYSRTH